MNVSIPATLVRAVWRARLAVLTIALTYVLSIGVGIGMVHMGNTFALTYRDQLVNDAGQRNPAAIAYDRGDNVRAALLDFAANAALGALPKTVSGLAVVFPYPMVAFQGWIGGIVSVRGDHSSRLDDPRSAIYYLLTLFLQVSAYALAVGAGVNVGLTLFRPPPYYQGAKWLGYSKEAVLDLVRIYVLAIPLFFIASLWEFLSTWNI